MTTWMAEPTTLTSHVEPSRKVQWRQRTAYCGRLVLASTWGGRCQDSQDRHVICCVLFYCFIQSVPVGVPGWSFWRTQLDYVTSLNGRVVSGRVAVVHYVNIQSVGQWAVAELKAARVVEAVRTDSVSVWFGILQADVKSDGRATSYSVREARAVYISVNKSVDIVQGGQKNWTIFNSV